MTPFELINIPLDLVEEPNVVRGTAGGGRPPVAPADKLPPLVPKADPPPVKQSEPVKQPETKPEPVKAEPAKPVRDPEASDLSKAKAIKTPDKPEKVERTFNFADAKRKVITTSPQTSKSESSNKRDTERDTQLAQLIASTRQTLAGTGTRVDIISDVGGEGGAAQMSYDLAVAKIFEREFQRRPVSHRKNEPPAEVEVVVRRDGSVQGRIVKRSGNTQLDRTVQQVLDSTRNVMPFPAHFKSDTRKIKIIFNLDDTNNG